MKHQEGRKGGGQGRHFRRTTKEAAKEVTKLAAKEAAKEATKEAAKEVAKEAATEVTKLRDVWESIRIDYAP